MIFLKTDDEIELLSERVIFLVGKTLAEVAKVIKPRSYNKRT
jgi:hypothetical protein